MVFIYFFANLLRCFLAIFLWIGGPELLLNGFGWSDSSRSSTMLQSVVSCVSPNVVFVWIPHGVQPPPREKVVWCCHKYVKLKFFFFVCLFISTYWSFYLADWIPLTLQRDHHQGHQSVCVWVLLTLRGFLGSFWLVVLVQRLLPSETKL